MFGSIFWLWNFDIDKILRPSFAIFWLWSLTTDSQNGWWVISEIWEHHLHPVFTSWSARLPCLHLTLIMVFCDNMDWTLKIIFLFFYLFLNWFLLSRLSLRPLALFSWPVFNCFPCYWMIIFCAKKANYAWLKLMLIDNAFKIDNHFGTEVFRKAEIY